MHIGLIGGIGPAAQDYYTRILVRLFAEAGAPLEMTTAHGHAPTVLANQAADRQAGQAEIFAALTERLARAGAEIVAVTSIAGHFCRREFAARSVLPAIDMIDAVTADIAAKGYERVGILGTRPVMQTRFYGGLDGITVMAPPEPELGQVHDAYAAMAIAGAITPEQREIFHAAARRLIDGGAEAIMLGGTDLALAFDAERDDIPLIDCAAIHVREIARRALGAVAA